MQMWQAFLFGVISYYVFTGLFGMSYWGSVVLSVICTITIDTVILSSKNGNKEKDSDNDENKKA